MNFTGQTEKNLLAELDNGHPLDVLCYIPARYYEEELAEIMHIWAQHRNDPIKLVSKLNNHMAKMIVEAANNIEELDIEQRERDCCRDADDAYQEMRRDRMAEEGF
jgi:hypothetical protein